MKYKTFMLLRNVGGVGLATIAAVGAFLGCRNAVQSTPPASGDPPSLRNASSYEPVTPAPPARQPNGRAVNATIAQKNVDDSRPVPTGATVGLTSRDTQIIALQKEPLSNGKPAGDSARWLSVGDGFKAEFRADAGSIAWNRAKVDLDGDKKWDEKWDFKDGSVKRRVSPADDDNYSAEYRLKSGETKWVRVK